MVLEESPGTGRRLSVDRGLESCTPDVRKRSTTDPVQSQEGSVRGL